MTYTASKKKKREKDVWIRMHLKHLKHQTTPKAMWLICRIISLIRLHWYILHASILCMPSLWHMQLGLSVWGDNRPHPFGPWFTSAMTHTEIPSYYRVQITFSSAGSCSPLFAAMQRGGKKSATELVSSLQSWSLCSPVITVYIEDGG